MENNPTNKNNKVRKPSRKKEVEIKPMSVSIEELFEFRKNFPKNSK